MSNFIEFENFETGNKVFVNVERILYIAQGESDNSTAIYLVLYTGMHPFYVKGNYLEVIKRITSK